MVPEDYTYEAPDGAQYTGDKAYVLNAIDSAEASMYAKTAADEDVKWLARQDIPLTGKDKAVFEALGVLLDNHATLAEHL